MVPLRAALPRFRALRRLVIAALILSLMLPLSAALAAPSEQGSVSFTVFTLENVSLRSGPGKSYAVITTIPHSTPLLAIGRNPTSSWVYVDYSGTQGWVLASLLELRGRIPDLPVVEATGSPPPPADQPSAPAPSAPAPPAPAPGVVTVTTTSNLRIRSGPGTTYAELGWVPAGTTLTPTGRNADGQWVFIAYGGVRGWMAAWLTTVRGSVSSLPVTTESGSGGTPTAPGAPPPGAGALPPARAFELGGQTHSLDHPDLMRYAGMTWVKFQHKWQPGQSPNDLAARIQLAHANGFRVLFSIPGPEYPTSIDFNAYVDFVRGVAALGADGIEVWNEMNLDREWPTGTLSPASYVRDMLAPAYRAIKAANRNTLVIAGALAPTGVDNGYSVWSDVRYLAGMRDAGAARYMDCLGVHHNAGATSPDVSTGHPADGGDHHYSWYFQPTFNVYASAFPGSKLCFTELGYVSGEGYGALPPMFWWGGGNTVGEQAEWLARAVQISRASNRVRLLIVYNVDFTHWGEDPQAGYAIVRPGGGCPACESLRAAMR